MNEMPFSINIFVANGNPDGLKIIERSSWIGKALMFPRAILPEIKKSRAELDFTGVYLLVGSSENGENMLYIGEGDPVGPRLESHFAKKDFWTKAIFFVSTNQKLNKAHIQYLEARLCELAKDAKRVILDNLNSPQRPTLSEVEIADAEAFLAYMLSILPLLGIDAFEKVELPIVGQAITELFVSGSGIKGIGYETTDGFVVKQGSLAKKDEAPATPAAVVSIRKMLLDSGILEDKITHYEVLQDYKFSSPSAAAAALLARSANGRTEWHDASGRTLKSIQESTLS
ncbi:MAG: GIY-YIG nuclease family protein [Campylobacterales bacterium]